MENYITPERIANSIMQDRAFDGYHLLIEGKKDIAIYRRFVNSNISKLTVTFGKYKLREVYNILNNRNFHKKLGIRDADFLRLSGNNKYDANYPCKIFATDGHDSEIMIAVSGVLDDLLISLVDEAVTNEFTEKHKKTIHQLILDLLCPLGYLKLVNKKNQLGLCFKPERPDGNHLKLDKFICTTDWKYLGNQALIKTVTDYSRNRSEKIADIETISTLLEQALIESHSTSEIVHGHDYTALLFLLLKHGLKCKELPKNVDHLEILFKAYFDLIKFSSTSLYKSLKQWETQAGTMIFLQP